jgi:hypothetical protein
VGSSLHPPNLLASKSTGNCPIEFPYLDYTASPLAVSFVIGLSLGWILPFPVDSFSPKPKSYPTASGYIKQPLSGYCPGTGFNTNLVPEIAAREDKS